MTSYRFYFLNATGGIRYGTRVDLPDDAAALSKAEEFSKDSPVEVWSGTSKIFFVEHAPEKRTG